MRRRLGRVPHAAGEAEGRDALAAAAASFHRGHDGLFTRPLHRSAAARLPPSQGSMVMGLGTQPHINRSGCVRSSNPTL